jgi:hypothetical protein
MIFGLPHPKLVGASVGALIGLLSLTIIVVNLVGASDAAINDARNIIPLTQTLPSIFGDAPSSAYPGSSANGWTPSSIQEYQMVPAAGGCIEHAAVLPAFVTRTYYYNNSTTIRGSDQASMTINVYVEPSASAAASAQSQVHTVRYQSCYAKETSALLNLAGMQVAAPPAVTPLLINTIIPGVAFESTTDYRQGSALRPYYDATAVVRYGQYRAVVDLGRCCQVIPLYTLLNTVDQVEERMRVAPENVGVNLPLVIGWAVIGVVGESAMTWCLIGYSADIKRRRLAADDGDPSSHWTTARSPTRRQR